ncbi:uncharacterized protein LOC6552722 [Drosophila erecta]|uniref:GG13192 n=1 Tax=Drosophila erecta TaxID=7220 RepID=B3NYM8_DROER|nr:uncharacterized protein LOC6552722 [Drosophila erecta]EDV48009.1 uncharacterized protein Dere_GG13192 [Drosophila erecta]
MWQRQVLVLGICGLLTMEVARCSASRFNGATSAGNQSPQLKLEMNAWQPFTQHNNWLILHATAPSSMQPERAERAEIRERRKEPERLPVNFYAYNHRYNDSSPPPGGNYKPNPSNDPSSYVLAISQQMRRGQLLRQLPQAEAVEPEVHKVAATLTHPVNGDDDNNHDDERSILAGEPGDGDQSSLRGVQSYLEPFERALVKVRDFCDALRSVIGDEEDGSGSNKLDATAGESEAAAARPPGATSKELLAQGRSQRLASADSEGRKLKKLKKKIQKLFFPLLIAYKLKFLTLIPVLIGGLTLLVGTTGLAGFFFALFTAVMSLKSSGGGGHSSKSLVLKKL